MFLTFGLTKKVFCILPDIGVMVANPKKFDVRDRGFMKLEKVEDAWNIFINAFSKEKLLKIVERDLDISLVNMVLAEDIVSPIDVPPFPRSAVDGYAVRAQDTFGATPFNPITLTVIDEVFIGDEPKTPVEEGTAIKITTGAPVPPGADAVVMIEDTELVSERVIEIKKAVTPAKNLAKQGEDVKKGDVVLQRGTRLRPVDLALLKSIGVKKVKVYKKPNIGVMTTGDELVEDLDQLSPAKIIDSNRIMLMSMIKEDNGEPIDLGIVGDEKNVLISKVQDAIEKNDAVFITGGTSVGPKDFLPQVIDEIGNPGILVHGVAIGPGKPVALAVIKEKPVILFPGYPVAAFLNYELFGYPLIQLLSGENFDYRPREKVKAILEQKVSSKPGIRDFVRVKLKTENDTLVAQTITRRGAGILSSLTKADGLLIIPEEIEGYDQGAEVEITLVRYFKEQKMIRGTKINNGQND